MMKSKVIFGVYFWTLESLRVNFTLTLDYFLFCLFLTPASSSLSQVEVNVVWDRRGERKRKEKELFKELCSKTKWKVVDEIAEEYFKRWVEREAEESVLKKRRMLLVLHGLLHNCSLMRILVQWNRRRIGCNFFSLLNLCLLVFLSFDSILFLFHSIRLCLFSLSFVICLAPFL